MLDVLLDGGYILILITIQNYVRDIYSLAIRLGQQGVLSRSEGDRSGHFDEHRFSKPSGKVLGPSAVLEVASTPPSLRFD